MLHIKRLSVILLSGFFIVSGCGQKPALPAKPSQQALKIATRIRLPANHRITEHTLPALHHPHKQSKIERKLRKSTSWANFYVPILEMHDTVAIPGDPYTMSPEQLDQELAWLKLHGFHTVTLDQVYNAIYRNQPLPLRPIVLTFDDGYESNFTTATAILKKYGFVATEFMVSGFINRPGFLTASELQQMEASHIWQIESHTMTHPQLTKLDATELMQQVTQPKAALAQLVGAPINYFAYPYGAYDGKVLRALVHTGYLLAVCTRQGDANPAVDGPLLLNRIAIHQGLPIQTYAQLLS